MIKEALDHGKNKNAEKYMVHTHVYVCDLKSLKGIFMNVV